VKERLDKILVDRGLVKSRERAKAMIMEGKVLVDGMAVAKAGTLIPDASSITLKGNEIPYVSRGGLKIKSAFERFGIDIKGKIAMDVGASTGGFTDYMLEMGAKKIYAIDVGYGQFAWKLRNDPRVVLMERTNIRHLPPEAIPEKVDFAAIDVSFISLKKVLPNVMEFLKSDGRILALVKPQFELEKADVGKGGIVKDEVKRLKAVGSVKEASGDLGLETIGTFPSPVTGQKGNVEYFIYLERR
jgi:23S rRNA (cytidine1920-2'-O)/16S rRNA (cytidine1409-2'-O)-methyltransferase